MFICINIENNKENNIFFFFIAKISISKIYRKTLYEQKLLQEINKGNYYRKLLQEIIS